MFKKIQLFVIVVFMTAAQAFAQADTEALERRVRELEQQVERMRTANPESAQLAEIERQIDALTREIEQLRIERAAPAEADMQQYGLGAAATKVYRVDHGISFGGYGEMVYENYDDERENGTASGATDQIDFLRAILYTGYKFSDRIIFNSEIEFEHASTGTNPAGEVSVEFAYLDFRFSDAVNARAGLLLVPFGLVNELHEPTAFLGAKRADVERNVIPTTWRENGAGLWGDIGPISYRAYVMAGLRSDRFSSAGIRSGRQQGARSMAEDLAFVARADWSPVEGVKIGGAYYTGDTAQGRQTPAGEAFDANLTMTEAHVDANLAGLLLRGLWVTGDLDDAAQLNAANNLSGNASVGTELGGWYAEAGYDLARLFGRDSMSLIPFVRRESYDTQEDVPAGFSENPAREIEVTTLGVSWKPIPQAVIKFDVQEYGNEANTGVDQFNLALGYIF